MFSRRYPLPFATCLFYLIILCLDLLACPHSTPLSWNRVQHKYLFDITLNARAENLAK